MAAHRFALTGGYIATARRGLVALPENTPNHHVLPNSALKVTCLKWWVWQADFGPNVSRARRYWDEWQTMVIDEHFSGEFLYYQALLPGAFWS
jgi:hypothetical protein